MASISPLNLSLCWEIHEFDLRRYSALSFILEAIGLLVQLMYDIGEFCLA